MIALLSFGYDLLGSRIKFNYIGSIPDFGYLIHHIVILSWAYKIQSYPNIYIVIGIVLQ